ncbi:DUF6443 domain-containing protein [Ferruginibacter sp.]
MRRIKLIVTKLLFAGCLLLAALTTKASSDPEIVTTFKGSLGEIVPDPGGIHSKETIDNIFYGALNSTIANPANDKITNVVSLLLDETAIQKIKTDFTAQVQVKVEYTLVDGTTGSLSAYTLEVNYTKAAGLKYNSRQTIQFKQCRKVKVTILNISTPVTYSWNVWEVIDLENRLFCKRDYVFNYTSTLTPSHSTPAADADELLVSWDDNPLTANGKTHIDIEWTWVDKEAQNNYKKEDLSDNNTLKFEADLLFKNNSSRVTIAKSASSYKIPMIYDGLGLLFYRIRPVQYKENGQVVNGAWSALAFGGITYYDRTTGEGHEERLNWQTTTSFAEDGKRKTVVQYFDGTLRGRQTVTKDNVTEKTVVAETFYDYQGRPAINILPAPTMNSIIKYTESFNKFVGSYVTPKDAFDLMPTNASSCSYSTPQLDNTSGAAQYYSTNNPQKNDGFNKFIPDAGGYPYTETRYTPDATGRIEAQGGVGNTFQLGKGNGTTDHDTKYYYGKPDQDELDALFGTEAGDATHYSKNMVRDANGQYSVSYVDMHGRTVATALAGTPPANVKALDSYAAGEQTRTKNLLSPLNNTVQGRSVVSSTTLIVTKNAPHQFHYQLSPLSAEIVACNPEGQTVCYDCYYDLEIRITGNCGFSLVKTATNLSFNNTGTPIVDQNCNTLPAPIVVDFTTDPLPEGEYNITKTLTVNKAVQDWYRENVFNQKNICKTLEDFYNENYALMLNTSACEITCTQCNAALGSFATYRSSFLQQQGYSLTDINNPNFKVPYEDEIAKSYNDAKMQCDELCNPDTKNTLAAIRDIMLEDMTPDRGQYARLNFDLNEDGVIDPNAPFNEEADMYESNMNKPYNIFKDFSGGIAKFQNPKDEKGNDYYSDEVGRKDITGLGLLPEDFSKVFKTSWANALIMYHPEYCKLHLAETSLAESYKRDALLEDIHDWSAAVTAGYVTDADGAGIVTNDPFFTGVGSGYKNTMISYIKSSFNRLPVYNGTNTTLWKLAWLTVFCQNNTGTTCASDAPVKPSQFTNLNNNCAGDWNYVWRIFRSLYLSEKERMVNDWLQNQCAVNYTELNANHYERRFGKPEDYYTSGGYMQNILDQVNNTHDASVDDEMEKQYEDNCESYKRVWIQQLQQCDLVAAFNTTGSPTNYTYIDNDGNYITNVVVKEITDGLKNVCINGSDENHPMGSSTVKPGTPLTVPSSFQDVITTVFNAHGINPTAICHKDIIDFPQPYDKQTPLSNETVVTLKDSCVCARITELIAEKNSDNTYPSGNSLSQYIFYRHNVTIRQSLLDSLIGGCNGSCSFWDPAIEVPALLSCNNPIRNCIECSEYYAYKEEFKDSILPGSAYVIYANPQNDNELNMNKAFAKFMNNKTGFTKTWGEYLHFEDTCTLALPIAGENVQTPATCIVTMQKTYNGGKADIGARTLYNTDGTYVIAGYSNSFGNNGYDAYLQKMDVNGNIIWSKTYGGPNDDAVYSVKKTADGGYIMTGYTKSFGGSTNGVAWLVKTDANGNEQWTRRFDDGDTNGSAGYEVVQTSDGGYAFTGMNHAAPGYANAMVIKTNGSGVATWAKSFDSQNSDAGIGIIEDGTSLVVTAYQYGQSSSTVNSISAPDTTQANFASGSSKYDAVIMKLTTSNGNVEWARNYNIENLSNTPNTVYKTATGYSFAVNDDTDWYTTHPEFVVVNANNNGMPVSLNKINGDAVRVGDAYRTTSDAGYVVTQHDFTSSGDIHLVKVNSSGTVQWTKKYIRTNLQVAGSVIQTPDGGYAMAGMDNSQQSGNNTNDIYFIKTDASGNTDNCSTATSTTTIGSPAYNVDSSFVWNTVSSISFGADVTLTDSVRTMSTTIYCLHACNALPPSGPKLCGDLMFPTISEVDTCNGYLPTLALNKATEQYQAYLEQKKDEFENTYLSKCLEAKDHEIFTVVAPVAEYHYTLYYYDQAGNLVKTVPPAGVQPNFSQTFLANVKTARQNGTDLTIQHNLPTQYRYNALNQVTTQKSPDGGESNFWYDKLGRLVVSQNAKQKVTRKYSYTLYDGLGRISEVGEKNKLAGSTVMSQTIAQNPGNLQSWLNASSNEPNTSITKTVYDVKYDPVCTQNYLCQQNLRNRVSYTYVQATDDGSAPTEAPWQTATFYTYDIHGNVDVLLQDYKATLGALPGGNRYKKVTYQYDLISGKVNEVAYQPGYADAFYHRYQYDAENKLTEVFTSRDYAYWKREAKYSYYRHGPLARTVLGEPLMEVQGIDYAYTLQGWLKGVNTTALQGGSTIGNGEDCGTPNSAVDNLYVYNRLSPYPSTYVARNSINFMPSTFESNTPDNFEAYIDPSLTGCEMDGTAGDEINSPSNNAAFDMGQDGMTDLAGNPVNSSNTNLYGNNIRTTDAYGYSLNYYNGDYSRINQSAANPFAALNMHLATGEAGNPYTANELFNGNIGTMVVSMPKLGTARVYGYNYDQLNRITNMYAFKGINTASNTFTAIAIDDYKEKVTYDANGNILTYKRNGVSSVVLNGAGGLNMDDLAYEYIPNSNKLKRVTDNPAYSSNYPDDIDNQTDADNYVYDEIGNLVEDKAEGITGIEWNVYGKIAAIHKVKSGTQTDITYTYDASGNRISKSVGYTPDRGVPQVRTTYYVRDASGNVMSVYEAGNNELNTGQLTQTELHLYGSSRLGVYNVKTNVQTESRTFISMSGVPGGNGELTTFTTGNKFFELTNHLGNVLVTISDKRIVYDANNDGIAEYYKADVITATDYYPFGMSMPGRKFSAGSDYRYGFNGQEKSDDIATGLTTALYWEYDSRIGRRWNVDPVVKEFESPYATFGGNPILLIDPDGSDWYRDTKGKNKGDVVFMEGNANHKGYKNITGSWTKRNSRGFSYLYGHGKGDILQSGPNDLLSVVVVVGKGQKRITL